MVPGVRALRGRRPHAEIAAGHRAGGGAVGGRSRLAAPSGSCKAADGGGAQSARGGRGSPQSPEAATAAGVAGAPASAGRQCPQCPAEAAAAEAGSSSPSEGAWPTLRVLCGVRGGVAEVRAAGRCRRGVFGAQRRGTLAYLLANGLRRGPPGQRLCAEAQAPGGAHAVASRQVGPHPAACRRGRQGIGHGAGQGGYAKDSRREEAFRRLTQRLGVHRG
mmetsp:Transcript_597/g.1622  ORF Transcript_597/g.1622 Transcript_597/m.1622 type:complete len:219 (-) Transcript_597:41-697(-)